jgi:hypothetical protein
MGLVANPRVERVQQILSTKNLNFYRVAERSATMFGRSSRFYIPHNLYYRLSAPFAAPNIYQLFALSRITNYRLSNWLKVFGFDLDVIPELQVLIPRKRTVILDSSIYDTEVWVPWFVERSGAESVIPIAPLGQLLSRAQPQRAREFLPQSEAKFLYAKVGRDDLLAFPDVAPESIVRIDPPQWKDVPSVARNSSDKRIFLIECDLGLVCSRLSFLGNGTVAFRSPQLPFGQGNLSPGRDFRILGVIDSEILTLPQSGRIVAQPEARRARTRHRLFGNDGEMNLKQLIRRSRVCAGLSFREASKLTRWIAHRLADPLCFTAASTLSDYETLSVAPRHIQKIVTLCIVYSISFRDFLHASGLAFEETGSEPIPDEFNPREIPFSRRNYSQTNTEGHPRIQNGFLGDLLKRWKEIPLFLRKSLSELTRLANFSVSDVFWVGGDLYPIHPWLENAEFVVINRRVKRLLSSRGSTFWEQPLYLLLTRDGRYLCGCCTLERGLVVVHPYPDRPFAPRQFKNGTEAEVIGRVTTIVKRLTSFSRE